MIFTINPQSIVENITNSSSEIFIMDTDKSLDIIREIMTTMLDLHNRHGCYYLCFNEVFKEPYISDGTKEHYKLGKIEKGRIVIESASDCSMPEEIIKYIEVVFGQKSFRRMEQYQF